MSAPEKIAVIVAGGNGHRMNAGIPKQFMLLNGKPVIFYSIEKFYETNAEVIVVLPEDQTEYWKKLIHEHNMRIPHQVTVGGATRSLSVYNGLKMVKNGDALVAVHDAARPMISVSLIEKLFDEASKKGNAIPVIPVKDSIRRITADENKSVDRDHYFIVQTPQVFHASALKKAFENSNFTSFTDEASLMEQTGLKIATVTGERANIKITFPEDIIFVQSALSGKL